MANITAAEVNKLRQMTGAGMMDCKHALVESEGDFEKAIDYLRKKGQKVAAKRSDRDANEGIVIAKTNDNKTFAAIILLSCETDFVAKNQEFIDFANALLNTSISQKPKTKEELLSLKFTERTFAEGLSDLIGKTGEKMELAHYQFIESPITFSYNHQGNRLATIMGLNKADVDGVDEIGHELAMQIAAMAPVAVDKDDVEQHIIDKEIEIGKDLARQEGKPEEMVEKIAIGKLNRFFKDNTLLNQDFLRDNKLTVRQYLQSHDKDLTVTSFKRHKLGE